MNNQSVKRLNAYYITNACEEGRLDTAKLQLFGEQSGLSTVNTIKQANLIFFNSCGHLNQNDIAAGKTIDEILRLKRSDANLVVWGCLPKINPLAIRAVYSGTMVGPDDWDFFAGLFNQPKERLNNVFANKLYPLLKNQSLESKLTAFQIEKLYSFSGNTWYIKIVNGCNQRCAYCSDRLVYNHVTSMPIETILMQFGAGLAEGYQHFLLIGRNLGSYGSDVGLTLADLLNKIVATYPHQFYKLSILNLSPEALIAQYLKFSKSVLSERIYQIGSHIQSGSTEVLKNMEKNFDLDEWVKIIMDIHAKYPNIRIATSIMVGFPGESDDDFEKTLELMRNLSFDRIDLYEYNERPNLPSLLINGRVSEQIKRGRWKKARAVARVNRIKNKLKKGRFYY